MKKTALLPLILPAVAGVLFIAVSILSPTEVNRLSQLEMLTIIRTVPVLGTDRLTESDCEYVPRSRTTLGCKLTLSTSPDALAPDLQAQGWHYLGETTSVLSLSSSRRFSFSKEKVSMQMWTNESATRITRLSIVAKR